MSAPQIPTSAMALICAPYGTPLQDDPAHMLDTQNYFVSRRNPIGGLQRLGG